MPRKRMIDPSFWRDEKVGSCTYMERLLFEGLWTFAEDNGVGRANPLLIKADIFPYDTLREADIQTSLAKLASLGLILLYEIEGQQYYFVVNFAKHQTINKPSQCYLPTPLPEHSRSTTVAVTSQDKLREVKLREEKREARAGEKPPSPRFTPPTVDEVKHYCKERGNRVDPRRFVDFYEAKGWMVGKNHMKDWKACVRTWEQRDGGEPTKQSGASYDLEKIKGMIGGLG